MNVLVIYDSVFGNTEKIAQTIAQAIAGGLGAPADAKLLHVSSVLPCQMGDSQLLVVGSPTRGFRPTEDIAYLLEGLTPDALQGKRVAAFDTRLKADEQKSVITRFVVKAGGYAAKRIADRLKIAGATLVVPPEGFYVADTEGPLNDGELERAAAWARSLLP